MILSYILKSVPCSYIILRNYKSVREDKRFIRQSWTIIHGFQSHCTYVILRFYDSNKKHTFEQKRLYDPRFDLKINVCHRDLYSMVQLFDPMFCMLFDV